MPPTKRNPRAGRRPAVIDDEPPLWPLLVWGALTVLWILGSVASFMAVVASAGVMPDDVTDSARRDGAWALVWLLVFALVTPAVGAVGAVLLRRRVAAAMFTLALLGSAALLWLAAPPADVWAALRAGLSS